MVQSSSGQRRSPPVNLIAVGLFASCLTQSELPLRRLLLALLAGALALKTIAVGELLKAQHVFAWLTPGALLGLAGGALVLMLALALPRAARRRTLRPAADGGNRAGQT